MENKRQLSPKEIEVIDVDNFNFDGYQVVRGEFFSHIYEPTISFSQNKIYVNMACIKKLPETDFVQILVNSQDKILIIRPCEEDARDSFRWCSAKKRKPKQITCRIFFAKIITLMGWNPDYRYKLLGKLIRSKDKYLFVFDLSTPETYVRTINAEGKMNSSKAPSYPEEWKNQFGLPVAEHQNTLKVNVFDKYIIFTIQENKKHAEREATNEKNKTNLSETHTEHRFEKESNQNSQKYIAPAGES